MTINNVPNLPGANPAQPGQIQLHSIHLPETVSNFPVAPGWWFLIFATLLSLYKLFTRYKNTKRINASKRKALANLEANKDQHAQQTISLLKWAAMQYFNRSYIAKMYGEDFQVFLKDQLSPKYQVEFMALITDGFDGQYRLTATDSQELDSACYQAAKLWLTHALPPKAMKKEPRT